MNDLARQPEYAALIDELARVAVEEYLREQQAQEQQPLQLPPQAA